MVQHFVNRKDELSFLEEKYQEDLPQLIVVYGRRRIGKTELLKKFLEDKHGIYYLCTRDTIRENVKNLKEKMSEFLGKEYFKKLEVFSFYELFKYFSEEIGKERTLVVLDEFPYLIELDRGVVSQFQKIWDETLSKKNVMLILCGSSIGMMETDVLGYRSPLYGRRTGQWKLSPLEFKYIREFFPEYLLEDLVKVWGICSGVPYYLLQFNPKLPICENIKRKILKKGEVLYAEPLLLLREEFKEPRTYTLILKYIALGYNTYGKLVSVTGIDRGNISKYLVTLDETHIVEHVLPLGQRKRGVYVIKDNFFNFWFRFVYPNLSDLELGLVDEVFERIKSDLNVYFGFVYERLILEFLKTKTIVLPFTFTKVGKWWHKDKEIDIVVLNEVTKETLFGECKWKDRVDCKKVAKELLEKSKHFNLYKDERKEYLAIFAKSFKKKINEFGGIKVLCFDLKDLESIMENTRR